jgi:CDP-glucose 4,6-dehydratase
MGFRKSSLENLAMNTKFWSGKRVLVTGHTGFKGSWLSLWLQQSGADLIGYSIGLPTNPCLYDAADVGQGMNSVTADIKDIDVLQQCFAQNAPEIVFHMAAQSLVRQSYADPIDTYATNVIGTANLLEAARRCDSVRVLIVVTSDKCYENREWIWPYRENDALGGHDPYSSSKGCAELVTAAYRSSFFNSPSCASVASVRAGNVIGGGDWAEDRIIPDVIRALLAGNDASIRNPLAVRPWQFVLEPLHGYLVLAERLWSEGTEFAGPWNFGPNDGPAVTVGELVDQLTNIWGDGSRRRRESQSELHEASSLGLDSSKARKLLGWSPIQNLPTTLQWIVEWHRHYAERGNARDITLEQIERYQERIPA